MACEPGELATAEAVTIRLVWFGSYIVARPRAHFVRPAFGEPDFQIVPTAFVGTLDLKAQEVAVFHLIQNTQEQALELGGRASV